MSSLAVKYRPQKFEDVCGQESVVKILSKQLELNEFKNCYIFAGASGSGKTTTARIFANEINKGEGHPIEIDAASNNGVDNVRQIIEDANERAIDSKYKIYIIDECHSLTTQAWQSFLKCIEEPPAYTIFIFCTTDSQKIPATILNRCMRFNFNKISDQLINKRLTYICKNEGITNYESSLDYIVKVSNGQMRDAIANLEKVIAYSNDLSEETTTEVLGIISNKVFFPLINCLIDGNQMTLFNILNYIYNNGIDLKLFIDQFLTFTMDILKYSIFKNFDIIGISKSWEDYLNKSCNFENAGSYYSYVVDKLLELKNMLKTDINPKNTCEVVLLQICRCS